MVRGGTRDIAWAPCHNPVTNAGDGLALAIGTGGSGLGPLPTLGPGRQFIPRNAPTLLHTGLGAPYLFLDGRVADLRFAGGGGGAVQAPPGPPPPARYHTQP